MGSFGAAVIDFSLSVSRSCTQRGKDWSKRLSSSIVQVCLVFRTWGRPSFGGGCVRDLIKSPNCAPQGEISWD